jgi:hypothetical protein
LGFPSGAENRIAGNRIATDHADGFQPTGASRHPAFKSGLTKSPIDCSNDLRDDV